MADITKSADVKAVSTATCGCPNPCPGGTTCKCATEEAASRGGHVMCSCGEHCGCNPCTCTKSQVGTTTTGKANCKCGTGDTCASCKQ